MNMTSHHLNHKVQVKQFVWMSSKLAKQINLKASVFKAPGLF